MSESGVPSRTNSADYQFDGWRPVAGQVLRRGKVPRYDGCSLRDWQRKYDQRPDIDVALVSKRKISAAEVRAHCDADDLWIVIHGIVFDITGFQLFHPGGEAILRACGGKDATELFAAYHKWVSCENMIGKLAVGVLDVETVPPEVEPAEPAGATDTTES